MILLVVFFLLLPTWSEVYRDRNGDSHPNNDWRLRGMFCIIAGVFSAFTLELSDYWIDVIRYTSIATIWFGVVFPYWINYVHLKNRVTVYMRKQQHDPSVYTHRISVYGAFSDKIGISYGLLTRKEKFDHIVNHMSDTAWPDKIVWWRQLGWEGRAIVNAIALCISIVIWIL